MRALLVEDDDDIADLGYGPDGDEDHPTK